MRDREARLHAASKVHHDDGHGGRGEHEAEQHAVPHYQWGASGGRRFGYVGNVWRHGHWNVAHPGRSHHVRPQSGHRAFTAFGQGRAW